MLSISVLFNWVLEEDDGIDNGLFFGFLRRKELKQELAICGGKKGEKKTRKRKKPFTKIFPFKLFFLIKKPLIECQNNT